MWEIELLNFWRGWVSLYCECEEKARSAYEEYAKRGGRADLNRVVRLRDPDGVIVRETVKSGAW